MAPIGTYVTDTSKLYAIDLGLNVLTYQALVELGVERPELRSALETQVGVALQRLYAQQHYDSGWGWWRTGRFPREAAQGFST